MRAGHLALQRHFRALAKFAHVESRFCGRKRREKVAFDTLINLCVRSTCSRSVAVGLEETHAPTDRALAYAREHEERGHQTYALRLLGDIAAQREPPQIEPAEASYRQALALAEELGMRPLQAHCHRGLGTLYAATGQREQARAALTTAIEMYRVMDMTFWLPETETALVQVEGQ
jgi:tetratricopeptide (TPR) repeat protein